VKPFFSFYGSKYRLARQLGAPKCDHVIEPFAGSAGFSVLWEPRQVTLIELDPVIVRIWKYLQSASRSEIESLPGRITHVDDLPSWACEEQKWLIGFWLNRGLSRPGHSLGNWGRNSSNWADYWSDDIKFRIANQLDLIRPWTIIEGSYEDAPDVEGHWHIDPPYHNAAGRHYRLDHVDYVALSQWCLTRLGFIQVCEAAGADWLPFMPFTALRTHRRTGYSEWLYEQDKRAR
jgi:hypothetical protein